MTTGGGDVKCVTSSGPLSSLLKQCFDLHVNFLDINNFIGSQASQNKAIFSVPRGVRFMISLNTSTFGNHNLSKMTLAHRTTRHIRAAPLISQKISQTYLQLLG